MKNDYPIFPGITPPSTDFAAVRDGRRSRVLWYDVDLSTARSIAGNTALILTIAANSFFSDQSPSQGNATVYFQDFTLTPTDAPPIYVGPGFVGTVPFTTLLIENTAQAGKRLRFFYGVDVDFKPSLSGSIALTGTISAIPYGYTAATYYKSITNLAANTPDTIVAPGANLNGILMYRGGFTSGINSPAALIAKSAAPASVIDGDVVVGSTFSGIGGNSAGLLEQPILIAAGKGLYYICAGAEAGGGKLAHANYTLL